MMRALMWREWREISETVWTWVACAVALAFVLRIVDEVIGISIAGAFLAIGLGFSVTRADGVLGVREFLLTRPVRRRTLFAAKIAVAHGVLNALLLFFVLSARLDLPGRFYGLFVDGGLGDRVLLRDVPAFYPYGLLFANALLALLLLIRTIRGSGAAARAAAFLVLPGVGIGTARILAVDPGSFRLLAAGGAVLFALAAGALLAAAFRVWDRQDLTGGAA